MVVLKSVYAIHSSNQIRSSPDILRDMDKGSSVSGETCTTKTQTAPEIVRRYSLIDPNCASNCIYVSPGYSFTKVGESVSKANLNGYVGIQSHLCNFCALD